MTKREVVETECSSCYGTGLYSGMCEREGTAVVCLTCQGTGCEKIRYVPFTERKHKPGIKVVYRSGGKFILGPMGPQGEAITYAEFKAGKLPPRPKSEGA